MTDDDRGRGGPRSPLVAAPGRGRLLRRRLRGRRRLCGCRRLRARRAELAGAGQLLPGAEALAVLRVLGVVLEVVAAGELHEVVECQLADADADLVALAEELDELRVRGRVVGLLRRV